MSIEGGRIEETDPAIGGCSPYLSPLEEEAPVRVSLSTEPLSVSAANATQPG